MTSDSLKNFYVIFFLSLLVLTLLCFGYFYLNPVVQTAYETNKVVYVVPNMASIKCEAVDTSVSYYNLQEDGFWISKDTIGVNTKIAEDISLTFEYGFWESLGKDLRIKYQVCDENRRNCNEAKYESYIWYGTKRFPLDTIDLTQTSLFIQMEKKTLGTWLTWKPTAGGQISYKTDKFGLTIYSSTTGYSKVICSTGCDLDCPEQGVRDKLVYNPKNVLNFYETTDYVEYWADVSQSSEQLGGTIWNSQKNEFCFGGFIYSAGTLQMNDGTTYVYPKNYIKKVDCCPGASVSITNGDKICQNDNTWKEILKDTQVECKSDYSCPGQGKDTCSFKDNEYFQSGYFCNSKSLCERKAETKVECCSPAIGCPSDQVCQNNKCVGGNVNKPVSIIETKETDLECKWYEKLSIKEKVDSGLLGWRKLFNMEKITKETTCTTKPEITLLIVLSIAFSFIALIIFLMKDKNKTRGRRK